MTILSRETHALTTVPSAGSIDILHASIYIYMNTGNKVFVVTS